jgi:hypothetical protein
MKKSISNIRSNIEDISDLIYMHLKGKNGSASIQVIEDKIHITINEKKILKTKTKKFTYKNSYLSVIRFKYDLAA